MAIGAVVGAGLSAIDTMNANKDIIKAYNENIRSIRQNYNLNMNSIDVQMNAELQNAIYELSNMQLNAMENQALVESALGESGAEGRSSGKIKQSIKASNKRQEGSLQLNYENSFYGNIADKHKLHMETTRAIQNAQSSAKAGFTQGTEAIFKVAGGAVKGATVSKGGAGLAKANSLDEAMEFWDTYDKYYKAGMGLGNNLQTIGRRGGL